MKEAFLYINYDNVVVLKDYLDVIKNGLEANGFNCKYVDSLRGIPHKDLIVFPMGNDAFYAYAKGYHNFIFWQQGATADESYLRHHSIIRKRILNSMDFFSFNHSRMNVFVSDELLRYYEILMKKDLSANAYVMPCFNDCYDKGIIDIEKKDYSKKRFAYVGSLAEWQCFNETVELYKAIESRFPDSYLKVLTFQVEEAKEIIKKKQINNFSVKQVPKEEVKKELEDICYGFVVRENNIINRVATPTKFSSYLAAGVLPIYSDCLRDFKNNCEKYNVSCVLSETGSIERVLSFVSTPKDSRVIEKNVAELFSTYYSADNHTRRITRLISELHI